MISTYRPYLERVTPNRRNNRYLTLIFIGLWLSWTLAATAVLIYFGAGRQSAVYQKPSVEVVP